MMPLTRRNVLIVLGVLTVAGGALFGAGAFSQVDADRSVTASTAGDGSAYVQFESTSAYTDVSGSPEQFSITFDNLNDQAVTTVDEAFNVSVSSDATAGTYELYVDDTDGAVGSNAALEFETADGTSLTSTSADTGVTVTAGGDAVQISLVIDGVDGDISSIPDTVTFHVVQQ